MTIRQVIRRGIDAAGWSNTHGRVLVAAIASGGLLYAEGPTRNAGNLFEEGDTLLRCGREADAAQRFERGLALSPHDAAVASTYVALGKAYSPLSRTASARAAFQRAMELDADGTFGIQAREFMEFLPGTEFRDCEQCPVMVVLPAGSFVMGSPDNEPTRGKDEGPLRTVTIAYSLAVGKLEVTYAEWKACRDDGACSLEDGGRNPPDHPAVRLTWNAAGEYTTWLANKTGKQYRLLTEAEWEYAARAGTATARYWGNSVGHTCRYANVLNYLPTWEPASMLPSPFICDDGYPETTSPTGNYNPNAFGLYDMLGNAWEWVEDCYADSYEGAPTDGSAVQRNDCDQRVLRGGGYHNPPLLVRSALRNPDIPTSRSGDVGFRVARTLR